jgi:hypothetical protein
MRTEATSKTSGQKKGLRGKGFSPLCIKSGGIVGKGGKSPCPGSEATDAGAVPAAST